MPCKKQSGFIFQGNEGKSVFSPGDHCQVLSV